jgi:hypothetical protein
VSGTLGHSCATPAASVLAASPVVVESHICPRCRRNPRLLAVRPCTAPSSRHPPHYRRRAASSQDSERAGGLGHEVRSWAPDLLLLRLTQVVGNEAVAAVHHARQPSRHACTDVNPMACSEAVRRGGSADGRREVALRDAVLRPVGQRRTFTDKAIAAQLAGIARLVQRRRMTCRRRRRRSFAPTTPEAPAGIVASVMAGECPGTHR